MSDDAGHQRVATMVHAFHEQNMTDEAASLLREALATRQVVEGEGRAVVADSLDSILQRSSTPLVRRTVIAALHASEPICLSRDATPAATRSVRLPVPPLESDRYSELSTARGAAIERVVIGRERRKALKKKGKPEAPTRKLLSTAEYEMAGMAVSPIADSPFMKQAKASKRHVKRPPTRPPGRSVQKTGGSTPIPALAVGLASRSRNGTPAGKRVSLAAPRVV